MRKLLMLCFFVGALLLGCSSSSSDGENGYPIIFQIFNIPLGLTNNDIVVDVIEKTGTSTYIQTGQIISKITGTDFTSNVKEFILPSTITANDKKYSGDVVLSFEIYIDVNGNGTMNETSIDISDAINNNDIPFSNEELYSINYSSLHVVGM